MSLFYSLLPKPTWECPCRLLLQCACMPCTSASDVLRGRWLPQHSLQNWVTDFSFDLVITTNPLDVNVLLGPWQKIGLTYFIHRAVLDPRRTLRTCLSENCASTHLGTILERLGRVLCHQGICGFSSTACSCTNDGSWFSTNQVYRRQFIETDVRSDKWLAQLTNSFLSHRCRDLSYYS